MTTATLLLERLGALTQQSIRQDAARHGLLPIHVQILHYLARANHYSDIPIAVADYFGITRGTVSQSLALLERRGLLVKHADPEHGKRVHMRLTPAAGEILEQSWALSLGTTLAAPVLEQGLRDLLVALQRQNGQRAFGICHECAHFLREGSDRYRCGLTREALAVEQTVRICREWKSPQPA